MEGGFVTQNCSECGSRDTVSEAEFRGLGLWVACPDCKKPMTKEMIDKNYTFTCAPCDIYIKLATLLPRWEDL